MVDEMERSVHDALCVVRRVLESKKVVAGGGAVEASVNVYLEQFAMSLASREQLAVAEFARALLIIPKVCLLLFLKQRKYYHFTRRFCRRTLHRMLLIWWRSWSLFTTRRSSRTRCSISSGASVFPRYTRRINERNLFRAGLDLEAGAIRDNKEAGVLEPLMSKVRLRSCDTQSEDLTICR